MKESELENIFRREVEKRGGRAVKWVAPGNAGVPDRIVLLPGGRCGFVELKAPGEQPRAQQKVWLSRLNQLGFTAAVLDSPGQIGPLIDAIAGGGLV